jgi:glycosyltransferase involved in cell wall biosynthesis
LRAVKIVYLGNLPPLHLGGGAFCNGEVLQGMLANGWTVSAIAPLPDGAQQTAYEAEFPGLRTHTFPACGDTKDAFVPCADAYREQREHVLALLDHLVATDRPDAIFIGRGPFALGVPALATRHGLPTLMVQHGSVNWLLAGNYPSDLAEEMLANYRNMDVTVVPARHMERGLRAAGFERVRAIVNGVDVERFRPGPPNPVLRAQLGIPPDRIVISHVSNMKAVKRVDDIVAAARHVVAEQPRLFFLIIGDGPSLDAVEQACRAAGLSGQFRFTGKVPYALMPDYMRLSDIVAMPSEIEALSRVYLETMACGKVLVASDVPGAREVVRDGETGLLFPRGDAAALARTLVASARDLDLRRRIGRQARAFVERRHLRETMVDGYLAVIDEMVSATKADRRQSSPSAIK